MEQCEKLGQEFNSYQHRLMKGGGGGGRGFGRGNAGMGMQQQNGGYEPQAALSRHNSHGLHSEDSTALHN